MVTAVNGRIEVGQVNEVLQVPSKMGEIFEKVVQQKRKNLLEAKESRFKGSGKLKEGSFIASDLATAVFATVQGVSQFKSIGPAATIGGIFGLIGGTLNMVQGFFVIAEALRMGQSGMVKHALRMGLDGLMLVCIGITMNLIALSQFGVALSAPGALFNSTFFLPIFLVVLTFPNLTQIGHLMIRVLQKRDLGSQALEFKQDSQLYKRIVLCEETDAKTGKLFKALIAEKANAFSQKVEAAMADHISDEMERFADEMGVEAAIEAFDLFGKIVGSKTQKEIDAQREIVRKTNQRWVNFVALRFVQMFLYNATLTFGILATKVAPQVFNAISKFSLSVPSSIATFMDSFEPFKRNSVLFVPKVEGQALFS